jgi:hypothetical protein
MGILDSETLFEKSIAGPLEKARRYEGVNLVVGIPFYNEVDTLPLVLKVVEDGLVSMKATDDKAIIICAGDPAGKEALDAIKDKKLQVPHMEFLMLEGANGRGMSIRALLELADRLEADLAILAADIIGKGSGLQPGSIQRMLKPLQYGYDLVLTSFRRQYFEDLLGKLFLGPLLETFFGYRISDAISGTYAISHDMVEEYCTAIKFFLEGFQMLQESSHSSTENSGEGLQNIFFFCIRGKTVVGEETVYGIRPGSPIQMKIPRR